MSFVTTAPCALQKFTLENKEVFPPLGLIHHKNLKSLSTTMHWIEWQISIMRVSLLQVIAPHHRDSSGQVR